MSNNYRHVRGDHNPQPFLSKTGILYEIGDLLYLDPADGNTVKPAGSFTWDTNLATTQETFHDTFWGVSNQCALAAQTGRQLVGSTTGAFRYPCAALGGALAAGTLFGPAKQSGNLLEPQKVVQVATEDLACGRLVENAPAGATSVLIEIVSSVMLGGQQAIA